MKGVVIGVIVLVILILAGLGIYAYQNPVEVASGEGTSIQYVSTTTTSYIATTTEIASSASYSPRISYPASSPAATAKPSTSSTRKTVAYRNTASAYGSSYVSGSAYHNGTFGLTVPGSYTVSTGVDSYGGVPDSASYHFYVGGVPAFTINVWSREQWSKLRNQETWNTDQGTGPAYYGEGTYLGENFTWIYSLIPGSYAPPAGIRFY